MGELRAEMKRYQTATDEKIRALEVRVSNAEAKAKVYEEIGTSSAELIDEVYGYLDRMEAWRH